MFTTLFILVLLLTVALRLWLNRRQAQHIARHRNSVPAEFAADISLEQHQKAADYSHARLRLGRVALAIDTALLLLLTVGGWLQAIANACQAALGDGYAYGLALFACVGLLGTLLELPLRIYQTFVVEARFGFNKMTPTLFVTDLIKGALLAALIGGPLLLAVFWVMSAMGSLWWLYVWLLWIVFNLVAMAVYPTVIAPIFNKFSPLPDGPLKDRINGLLQRCGFTASGLFVMDGSRRSAHGNAYFTGFGRAKRIVFFDTLIERLSPAEVEAVLAHELGHFHHRHIWKFMAWIGLLSLGLLWLLGQLIESPIFFASLGVTTPSMAMGLLLFSQVLPVFMLPLTPLASALSRRNEYQADAYAAANASAGDLISSLVKLYRDNAATLTPDPLHSLFYDSHPPASLRVARLREHMN
jgi:STE24 endopeptidase